MDGIQHRDTYEKIITLYDTKYRRKSAFELEKQ